MTVETNTPQNASDRFLAKLQAFVEGLDSDEQVVFRQLLDRGNQEDVSGYLRNDTIYINGRKWVLICVPTGMGQQFCFYYPA